MNIQLANTANDAIRHGRFDAIPGHCEVFAREVIQARYGNRYDQFFRATAAATGKAFKAGGYSVKGEPELGDLLFKLTGSGGAGHVGIYTWGDRIAENSSVSKGRVRGALGYRTLEQFGAYELIVRLPEIH